MSRLNTEQDFWSRVNSDTEGCWFWDGTLDPNGYGRFNYQKRKHWAHRLAFVFTYGPVASDQVVRHMCDTPRCVRPSHLTVGTQADNMRDMSERGRAWSGKGELGNPAKLTDEDVRQMLARRQAGENCADIAKDFPVTRQRVWQITRRNEWTFREDQEAMA